MPCQQMCPRPCLKYPFCHLSMFTNCVSFSFCVGNWVWFIQSHCFVEAQYLTFGLVCHLQQNMSTVSATCATFRSPLRLSFPSEQVNGKTSSNLKMVTLGWTKTCFPTLNNNRSRFRVSCSAKPETVQKVCDIVRKQLALSDETQLTPESKFTSLGADSLDTVEIVMNLEEEFDISVEEENSENITTVQEAANLIDKLVQNKAQA